MEGELYFALKGDHFNKLLSNIECCFVSYFMMIETTASIYTSCC